MADRTTEQRGAEGRARVRNLYAGSVTEAEQEALETAQKLEGLSDEIAMLRVKLMTAIEERPEDLKLIAAGVNMLVKAVTAQYRLSPKAKGDLAESITAVLNNLGDQLVPPS
ncbi:MAG: hypothetical protein IH957_05570 [Chloroflexi bacterium]|nr:hypothetical protein [Chloroflexota bacterium]